ncbi:unnamed protein product [Thlaspi arvense]|uniref:Uncharacterized protein n=1 Tax=Thlaspi arvense TaxID=13288 RepID=A0AAU9TB17_THLAR|nr:unnamed protein product [Thlaspi arvense]
MARISLLFSLAFALALGSLFLSVSGHAPPAPTRKLSCPKTVSELQTLPFTEIAKLLNRKERLVPKTAEFKAMFTLCKGYVAYLESLYKFENPIVDVLGIAKAKYALMTNSILAAQATAKVDKKASLKLKKSCVGLTKGFLQIQKTIVKISAKHDYKADAKITLRESKNIGEALIKFKKSLNAFIDVVCDLDKKKKTVLHRARALEEDGDDESGSAFDRFLKNFSDKFGGYLGGKPHGRELVEADVNANSNVGADVKGFEALYEKFSNYFGGYLGGDSTHGRELLAEAPSPVSDGAEAGEKVDGSFQNSWDKFFQFFGPFFEDGGIINLMHFFTTDE